MYEWAGGMMDTLWHNGLAAIPLVLVAAAASRFLPCLPATRHLIWVTVLVWLVGSSVLPQAPVRLIKSSSSTTQPDPQVSITAVPVSETGISEKKASQPRRLTSRLAKRNAPKETTPRRADVSRGENRFSGQSEAILRNDAQIHGLTRSSTPPPRYAARAETPAPDKLARAQEAAGPRSLADARTRPVATERPIVAKPTVRSAAQVRPPAAHGPPLIDENRSVDSRRDRAANGALKSPLGMNHREASPAAEDAPSPWHEWSGALLGVRDAVTQVPPLPRTLWIGGSVLLLVLAGVRVIGFRRHLRSAKPAPRDVRMVVEAACKSLGLVRAPQILMVEGRISPMVWCGVTPKLILPTALWEQLDELGRKAVVFHELAHIRRLDHRTAWIESVIGMLYWWHPLVWWVRGRLHAEAENCCDAWVMTLLPKTRRAYATALLKTREYLSGSGKPVPAMGIGITPGRARLFARRLTMVMTESIRPKLSATGISLVMLVAICGWVASPARSCPEEEAAAAKAAKTPCATAKAPCAVAGAKSEAPCAKAKAEVEAAKAGHSQSTFEKHMAGRATAGVLVAQPVIAPAAVGGVVVAAPAQAPNAVAGLVQASGQDAARAKRMAELQQEMARLERKIETLSEALEEQEEAAEDEDDDEHERSHNHAHDGDADDDEPGTPRPPRAPRAPRPPMPPHAAHTPMPPMPPMPPQPPTPRAHGRGFPASVPTPKPGQSWADVSGEATSWRTYKLSKGKGEDFYKFMSRSDVPIWVRSNSAGIDIQATPPQHEIFEAFFAMVDPSEERGSGAGFFGRAPMLAFADAGSYDGCGKKCGQNCLSCMYSAQLRATAEEMRAKARADAVELRAQARGEGERARAMAREEAEQARMRIRRHARDARSEARDQHEMIEGLERQAQVLAEVADSYREQGERINERAQSVTERVQKDAEVAASADAYRIHVESLERSAEELNRQAEQLQLEVETIEQRAREVEENAREMEQHAEELDQRAEAVREAVETLESGVQPTDQLVDSVIALVNNIEQFVPESALEAIEEAASALVGEPDAALEEIDEKADEVELEEMPTIELEEIPAIDLDEILKDVAPAEADEVKAGDDH